MLGKLPYAAPCIAVSPSSFIALTSAPSWSISCVAISASGSVPASSSGAVVPRPAAAIRAVVPRVFGMNGSAPNSMSRRINAASARSAASRKGVVPPDLIRDAEFGWRRAPSAKRQFTSAPSATSVRTKSRLLTFPDPTGAGSPRSLSSGLRTQLMVCSGVNPVRSSFTSAPAFTSSIASSKWPFLTAMSNGLMPSSIGWNVALLAPRFPTFFLASRSAFTSTPASSRLSATSMWPARTAKNIEVNPDPSVACASAPASMRALTTDGCPSAAAHMSAV